MAGRIEQRTGRSDRKRENTKRNILDVSIKLFRKQGVDGTSMEQIAEVADIARRTLYNYFPAKEAIINEFIQLSFRENNPERLLAFRKLPDTKSRMVSIISVLVEGVAKHKELFERYLVYKMQSMVTLHQEEAEASGLRVLSAEIIYMGRKNNEIRDDLPEELLFDFFEFVFIEVVKRLYFDKRKFRSKEVIEQHVDIFIRGVGSGV